MKQAVVTISKRLKIYKNEIEPSLREIFRVADDFFGNPNTIIRSNRDLEHNVWSRFKDVVKDDTKNHFKRFLIQNPNEIEYLSYDFSNLYVDKNSEDKTYYEFELISSQYTILDGNGQFMLLVKGDRREELKINEPTFEETFFIQIKPEIGFKTYIPY